VGGKDDPEPDFGLDPPRAGSHTVTFGDILDQAKVGKAVSGQESVCIVIGIPPTRNPVTVFSQGTRNVLDAMNKYGVGRLFCLRPPVRRVSRPCPALQDAGLLPGQLFGLVNEKRMAPQLTLGLKGHRLIELPSAAIRLHGARGGN